jgi:hypothetical protein
MVLFNAISAAKTAFELARSLQNGLASGQVKAEEVPARLMELQQHILSMQAIVHDLAEENRTLKEKMADLLRCADIGNELTFEEGVYWHSGYPYCPPCWDVDRKPVRLAGPVEFPTGDYLEAWTCPLHKVQYMLPWNIVENRQKNNQSSS